MSRLFRKFVAVLMLLWLPLFSGNALAVSIVMPLQQGEQHTMQVAHENMDDMSRCDMTVTDTDHGTPCQDCELCQMACTAYLSVPGAPLPTLQTSARENTPYLVSSHTFTSAPLVPPPLARA